MLKLFLFLFVIQMLSCSNPDNQHHINHQDSLTDVLADEGVSIATFSKERTVKRINDSIIRIEILPDVKVDWNNKKNRLEHQSIHDGGRRSFQANKTALANEIRNTFKTNIICCPDDEELAIGDIAFIVLNEIEQLPSMEIFKVQFDVLEDGCPYPKYLFAYINKNRLRVADRVENYLSSID